MTKIKGEWVRYDYSIDVPHTVVNKVLEGLNGQGIDAEYLGKSKVVKINGDIRQLNKRFLFFRFNQ